MHKPRLGLGGALAVLALAGCSSGTPAYVELQGTIKRDIIRDDQRPVQSVACTPRVQDVSYDAGLVHLKCLVSFAGGSSYTSAATIEARSYQVAGYNFEFDEPGPIDITTAPLPQPAVSLGATSPGSLYYARNLAPVVHELWSRFPGNRLILSMALYPGELVAVIGSSGQAQLVTAHPSGTLTVGPQTQFTGERSGIEFSQVNPDVPQQLAKVIAARVGIPMSRIERFVLGTAGQLAIWKIFPSTGSVRFQAHIQGDSLERISGAHRTSLN